MTPALVYLMFAVFSILILSPLGPFLHRYTYHIPLFLSLVAIGTLIYSLTAFPFSPNNRLKVRFQQRLDLTTGQNNVTLTSVSEGSYLFDIVQSLPSTYNQTPGCGSGSQKGVKDCTYKGISPRVVPSVNPYTDSLPPYNQWLTFNVTHAPNTTNTARFRIRGLNTRACKFVFDHPISDFKVSGSGRDDPRFPKVASNGSKELRLWSRAWEREWSGTFSWQVPNADDWNGMSGSAICLWSDANVRGTIPALDEVWRFAPSWVAVTKAGDGLVEGFKKFKV